MHVALTISEVDRKINYIEKRIRLMNGNKNNLSVLEKIKSHIEEIMIEIVGTQDLLKIRD